MSTEVDPTEPFETPVPEPDGSEPTAAVAGPPAVTDPTVTAEHEPVSVAGLDALDAYPDLPDATWPTGRPASGIRMPVPVAVLALLFVAFLGAAVGARLKGNDQPAAGGGNGGRNGAAAAGFASAAGAGGQGFAGRGGGGVAGTVKAVDGDRVTVTGANGQDSTVVLGPDTAITRTGAGSAADITPGQTLTVRGTAGSDGSTQAAQVIVGAGLGGGRGQGQAQGPGAPDQPAPPASTP